jgi:hypothetical protein
MDLPQKILKDLNLRVSKHKHPEALDWQQKNGKWTALDDHHKYVVIHDKNFGYVIAETKTTSYIVQ